MLQKCDMLIFNYRLHFEVNPYFSLIMKISPAESPERCPIFIGSPIASEFP